MIGYLLSRGTQYMNKCLKSNVKTVLLLTTEFDDQLIGGLGRHVNDLVRTGTDHNVIYIVMTIAHTETESYMLEDGIHIFRLLPWQERWEGLSDYIQNINFRFTQFILQDLHLRFDLIHVHDWFFAPTACQIKKMFRTPLITTFHSTEQERKQFNNGGVIPLIVKYEDQLLTHSDHIIVCSQYMKKILLRRHPDQHISISVIPNGVILDNMKRFLSKDVALTKYPFIENSFLFGIGRMVKEKGFQLLIEAFSIIHHKYPTLKLVFAGRGPYERNLKKIAELKGLESKVIFVGFVNEIERNTLLSNCEMVVVPSYYEPFGIVTIEAFALARPVLAFKIGGLGEILGEHRGILVDQVSSLDLAAKLDTNLANQKGLKEIACHGNQAMKDEYQWVSIIGKIITLYNKVVGY